MAVLQSKYVNIKRLRKGKISVDSFENISRPIFSLVFRFPPAFISNVNLFKVIYFIPNYIRRLSVNKTENINSRINIIETRAVINIIIVFLYSSRPLIRTWQSAVLWHGEFWMGKQIILLDMEIWRFSIVLLLCENTFHVKTFPVLNSTKPSLLCWHEKASDNKILQNCLKSEV